MIAAPKAVSRVAAGRKSPARAILKDSLAATNERQFEEMGTASLPDGRMPASIPSGYCSPSAAARKAGAADFLTARPYLQGNFTTELIAKLECVLSSRAEDHGAEPSPRQVALLGGIYSNYLALEAALADIRRRGVSDIYCLGDLGAFGPHPDRAIEILREQGVACVRGNYDDSIGRELADCQCGYTDPRDNYFAQISYDYTLAHTSRANRAWLRELPGEIRLELGGRRVLLCHGSPRRINEFLWESSCSTHFLAALCDQYQADAICTTHTGLKWQRELSGGRLFLNVGVLGRPENDG